MKDSGADRESYFLTTKIPLAKQSRAEIMQQGGQLLHDLGTDYVDLLLLQWPSRTPPFAESFGALKELQSACGAHDIVIAAYWMTTGSLDSAEARHRYSAGGTRLAAR